ncbi:hypothetical protein AB8P51_04415 [Muriicola sp. SD30]|uniref:hypothetical protein n=1 Tax=Muriicola sp. SD30 TaxID=3240936 RepID=UPI0035103FC5
MKTKALVSLFTIFFFFSCSTEEESDLQLNDMQNLQTQHPLAGMLATESGRQSLAYLFNTQNTAKGNGNGVIFIKNGADYVACGGDDKNLVCVYEIEDGFYKSPIDVHILPNGEAQFKAQSKNFAVEVYTLPNFDLIYSNLCMEEFEGNLHINVKGTFELITDDPFVDFDYYTFVEATSANNMQITTAVNDAVRNLDIDLLTWDCVEPTSEKKLKVTSLFKKNGTQNFKIRGL